MTASFYHFDGSLTEVTAQTAANSTNHDTHFMKRVVVVVPLFLPQGNWSFESGKNNGVVCAHVMRNAAGID